MGMSLLSYCIHFHFGRRECPCSRGRPTIPKLLSIIISPIAIRDVARIFSALITGTIAKRSNYRSVILYAVFFYPEALY